MNKKANIPITILVIGILGICGFALFSFVISSNKMGQGFSELSIIEKIKVDKERMDFFSTNLDFSEEEINNSFAVQQENLNGIEINFIEESKRKIKVRYFLD